MSSQRCQLLARKRETEFRNKVSLSSSSSALVATDVDTKELGLIESRSENAEES